MYPQGSRLRWIGLFCQTLGPTPCRQKEQLVHRRGGCINLEVQKRGSLNYVSRTFYSPTKHNLNFPLITRRVPDEQQTNLFCTETRRPKQLLLRFLLCLDGTSTRRDDLEPNRVARQAQQHIIPRSIRASETSQLIHHGQLNVMVFQPTLFEKGDQNIDPRSGRMTSIRRLSGLGG